MVILCCSCITGGGFWTKPTWMVIAQVGFTYTQHKEALNGSYLLVDLTQPLRFVPSSHGAPFRLWSLGVLRINVAQGSAGITRVFFFQLFLTLICGFHCAIAAAFYGSKHPYEARASTQSSLTKVGWKSLVQ